MRSEGVIFRTEMSVNLEPDATTLYDVSGRGHNGTFKGSGEPAWTQLESGLWVNSYDGSDDIITVGDIESLMQSVLIWIYPDDNTTRSILDFDSGTHSIEFDGSGDLTATGWSSPTRYVNGAVANAVTQSSWNFLAVTTATAFTVSAFIIGQEASFYDGKMGSHIILSFDTLDLDTINAIYASQKGEFEL